VTAATVGWTATGISVVDLTFTSIVFSLTNGYLHMRIIYEIAFAIEMTYDTI